MPLITRTDKGSRLTIQEMDGNLTYLENLASTGGFESIEINLSSSQILNLFTSPVELLPAPGAGKYYVWKGFVEYTHVSTAYKLPSGYLKISNSAPYSKRGTAIDGNLIKETYSQITTFNSETTIGDVVSSNPLNNGVSILSSNENPTLGNGTIKIKLDYKVISFG